MEKELEFLKMGQPVTMARESHENGIHSYLLDYGSGLTLSLSIRNYGAMWMGAYGNPIQFKFGITPWAVIRGIIIEQMKVQAVLQYAQTNQIPVSMAFKEVHRC